MATNLTIDDILLEHALKVSQLRSKQAVVAQALMEYIQKCQQRKLLSLFGTVKYNSDYDYKAQR